MPTRTVKYRDSEYWGDVNFRGQPHGTGTFTYKSGDVIEIFSEDWKNGVIDGSAMLTYRDGSDAHARYKNGVLHGDAFIHNKDGSEYIRTFSNGRLVSERPL